MSAFFRSRNVLRCFALLAALLLGLAHSEVRAQAAYVYSEQQLEQMLAPIALYPDTLLSQVLVAAGYPADVVEAARWSREHPDAAGEAAVGAVQGEDWDQSVKSLLAFPQLLEYLRDNLQWTQALGDAFLAQQGEVMDAVQLLRRKAQAAGSLRTDDHLSVIESDSNLLLQPADPQIVYVPYYDPLLVYGTWTWTAYPPVYLRPWRAYHAAPAHAGPFRWGPPVGVPAAFFRHGIDWRRRQIGVAHVDGRDKPPVFAPPVALPRPGANAPAPWRADAGDHKPPHRGGAGSPPYFGAAALPPAGRVQAETRDGRARPAEQSREPPPRFHDAGDLRTRVPPPAARLTPRPDAGVRAEAPHAPRIEPHLVLPAQQQRPVAMAPSAQAPASRDRIPAAGAAGAAARPVQAAPVAEPHARSGARPNVRP